MVALRGSKVRRWAVVVGAALATLSAAPLVGAYTAEQAEAGRVVYDASCTTCHGPAGQGGFAPDLAGPTTQLARRFQDVASLHTYVAARMPLNAPGSLSDDAYWVDEEKPHGIKVRDLAEWEKR